MFCLRSAGSSTDQAPRSMRSERSVGRSARQNECASARSVRKSRSGGLVKIISSQCAQHILANKVNIFMSPKGHRHAISCPQRVTARSVGPYLCIPPIRSASTHSRCIAVRNEQQLPAPRIKTFANPSHPKRGRFHGRYN